MNVDKIEILNYYYVQMQRLETVLWATKMESLFRNDGSICRLSAEWSVILIQSRCIYGRSCWIDRWLYFILYKIYSTRKFYFMKKDRKVLLRGSGVFKQVQIVLYELLVPVFIFFNINIKKGRACMCLLYVTNDVEEIGINNGKIVLKKYEDEHKQKIPCCIVEGISIFGRSRITEPCMRYCLNNGIRVSFFTVSGRCYGHITAEDQYNAERIRKQVLLSNDKNFSRKISKKIIKAKIHNQYIVAKRYIKSSRTDAEKGIIKLKQCIEKISTSITCEQIRGYEGLSSREYFKILGSLVAPEFKFTGRNRRPPLDPVNTMLSLGYSLLTKEMQGELENRGLISQVGFFHEDHIHHPTLASDMIEEWRPVIVDSLVLSLIRGHEIDLSAFEMCDGKCLFTKTGLKLFLQKYEKKLFAESKYLPDINRPITFRQAIWHQAENLAKAIDESDSEKYIPIQIR